VKYLGSNAATILSRMGYDLSGKDFSGTVLRGADLSEAHLSKSTFNNADLSSCDLTDAQIEDCTFEITDLLKAKFIGVNGHHSSFKDIFFDNTNLSFADLSDASFESCRVRNADFGNAIMDNADFENFNLDGVENISASVRLRITGIFGTWIGGNPLEYLELTPLYLKGRLHGVLHSAALEVEFSGTLNQDQYFLTGTQVAKGDRPGRYTGVLSVHDGKSLQLELWPNKSKLPTFKGIFSGRSEPHDN
jgi:uncharacterized protein YjbI with pentapeptide repeats